MVQVGMNEKGEGITDQIPHLILVVERLVTISIMIGGHKIVDHRMIHEDLETIERLMIEGVATGIIVVEIKGMKSIVIAGVVVEMR